jgi:hypothetical protein
MERIVPQTSENRRNPSMIPITINISEEQAAWVNKQPRGFNMSALLRELLTAHIEQTAEKKGDAPK